METTNRTFSELFQGLIDQAKERGFGSLGIFDLVARLSKNRFFSPIERDKIFMAIESNKPKGDTGFDGYYWPRGDDHRQTRLDFIERLLKAYENL